jgi:hypothetical protein
LCSGYSVGRDFVGALGFGAILPKE